VQGTCSISSSICNMFDKWTCPIVIQRLHDQLFAVFVFPRSSYPLISKRCYLMLGRLTSDQKTTIFSMTLGFSRPFARLWLAQVVRTIQLSSPLRILLEPPMTKKRIQTRFIREACPLFLILRREIRILASITVSLRRTSLAGTHFGDCRRFWYLL
jgi:hypothetical protein